jgi:hypothetical protein
MPVVLIPGTELFTVLYCPASLQYPTGTNRGWPKTTESNPGIKGSTVTNKSNKDYV